MARFMTLDFADGDRPQMLARVIGMAFALPLAWFLWRRLAPWAQVFQLLGIAPFTLPPLKSEMP